MSAPAGPVRFLLLALPEASPAVIYSIYEVLTSVGTAWTELTGQVEPGRDLEVVIVARDAESMSTSLGFPIQPQAAWETAGQADVIVVPDLAISPEDDPRGRWPEAEAWLAAQARGGACVTSVCSGSVLLASAGLLEGLEATTHWAFAPLFRRVFPGVRLKPERVLCPAGQADRIVTSGGAAAWSDLVLYLVSRFAGRARAVHVAKVFLLGDHSEGQLPFAAMTRPLRHEDAVIDRCQRWIAEHYAVANPVAAMIEHSGLSSRSFKRRFRAATGYSAIDYVQHLRVEEAKHLLETTKLHIELIAEEVGYMEPAFFRRLFRRLTGITPLRYRERFRTGATASDPAPTNDRGACRR